MKKRTVGAADYVNCEKGERVSADINYQGDIKLYFWKNKEIIGSLEISQYREVD